MTVSRRRMRERRGVPAPNDALAQTKQGLVPVAAYASSLESALQARARGGLPLDIIKSSIALTSAVLTVPLVLALSFQSGQFMWPALRWPWRTLDALQPEIEAAKSAIATASVGGDPPNLSALYDLLDALQASRRPSHSWLRQVATELTQLRAKLGV